MNASESSNGLMSKWWGPAWWSILHSVVDSEIPQKENFLRLTAEVLPCAECRTCFNNRLSFPEAGSLRWLQETHTQASGRTAVGQPAKVTARIVAFVAKCVAINFPTQNPSQRGSASIEFLNLLHTTFPIAFVKKITPASTREEMMVNVVEALQSTLREPPCSSLEQLRYYSGLEARVERSLQNVV